MKSERGIAVLVDGVHPPSFARTDYKHFVNYIISDCGAKFVFSANQGLPIREKQKNCLIVRDTVNQGDVVENRLSEIRHAYFLSKCIINYREDICFVFSFYFSLLWIPLLLCRLYKIDVYVDFLSVPLKRLWLGRLFRTMCKLLADGVIVIDKSMLTKLFFSFPKKQIFELPMGVSFSSFNRILSDKENKKKLREKYQLKSKMICFVSLGTVHSTRRLEDVVDAYLSLNQNVAKKLLIIGGGPHYSKFRSYVESKKDDSIVLTGALPFNDAIALMSCGDVGITYFPIELYDTQQPLKTIEYMAAGLPVIAVNSYGNRRVVKENENGFLIGDSPDELYKSMQKFLNCPTLIEEMKSKLLIKSVGEWDYDYICDKYLKKILQDGKERCL